MVRSIIDVAIKQCKPLMISYFKDGISVKDLYIYSIDYSKEFGKNYICAYCEEYKSRVTFNIDKIIHADIGWIDIFSKDTYAKQDGLYLFTCRGDMHLEFELRKYKKGERLQDEYQNEDGIKSWYSSIDALAYHYIPFFTNDKQREWIPFELNNKERKCGFYTFAYIQTELKQQKDDIYDWVDDYDTWTNTCEFPSPWELTNTKENGIYYTVNALSIPFNKLRIPDNIKIIAYNYCTDYREKEHTNHWKLADELGF